MNNNDEYYIIYRIEKGDSLYKIAKRYNINPQLLANFNITAEGDTIDTVANIFGISKDELLKQNDIIYLLKDQIMVNKRSN